MNKKTALILVDIQNDFCQGGQLAVPDADSIVPLINQFQHQFSVVVATKDWHPKDHMSFASNHADKNIGDKIMLNGHEQVLWPVHCVEQTRGAEFHPDLRTDLIEHIVYKGSNKWVDSYSGFFDNGRSRSTGLADYLRSKFISSIYIVGLATDYCVQYTALDGVHLDFEVSVIADACRGVGLHSNDINNALQNMQSQGVSILKAVPPK